MGKSGGKIFIDAVSQAALCALEMKADASQYARALEHFKHVGLSENVGYIPNEIAI